MSIKQEVAISFTWDPDLEEVRLRAGYMLPFLRTLLRTADMDKVHIWEDSRIDGFEVIEFVEELKVIVDDLFYSLPHLTLEGCLELTQERYLARQALRDNQAACSCNDNVQFEPHCRNCAGTGNRFPALSSSGLGW